MPAIVRCEQIDDYAKRNATPKQIGSSKFVDDFINQYPSQRVAMEQFKSFAKKKDEYGNSCDKYKSFFERMFSRSLNGDESEFNVIEKIINPIKESDYHALKSEINTLLDSANNLTSVNWHDVR